MSGFLSFLRNYQGYVSILLESYSKEIWISKNERNGLDFREKITSGIIIAFIADYVNLLALSN